MTKKQIAITLGIMCFALTLAICIQLKIVQKSNDTVSQGFAEDRLRDEVLRWKEKYDATYEAVNNSTKELEEIRKKATQDDVTAIAKQQEITKNNILLGMTEVTGPGFEITLTDNVSRT